MKTEKSSNQLISFAQDREDIILYHLLRDVPEPIRWIDVGANDPVHISVTKFFSVRGGSGVNIEPQMSCYERLCNDRPADINLNAGISNESGTLTLFGTGEMATFDAADPAALGVSVPVMTLTSVCEQYPEISACTHFLKIDVEGWERQCLEGMDFMRFRPWILCIESSVPGTDIPSYDVWEHIVLQNGYLPACTSGINRYYIATEHKRALAEFRDANELDTIYDIVSHDRFMAGFHYPLNILGLQHRHLLLVGDDDCIRDYAAQSDALEISYSVPAPSKDLNLNPDDTLLIATPDSLRAIDYKNRLMQKGIDASRILWQPLAGGRKNQYLSGD